MTSTPTGYAVIDIETTGFCSNDRVVEVAVVALDEGFQRISEYETLIDPQRDLGPTQIHGITPAMVSMAPTFSEVAAALAMRLEGRTLVAHNLLFECRMLAIEFERLGASLDAGHGICTLRLTREKLPRACEALGVQPPEHHRALSDARATAELLSVLKPDSTTTPVSVRDLHSETKLRTHRRCANAGSSVLGRLIGRSTYRDVESALLNYVDLLDWVLDDLTISQKERTQLNDLERDLELSPLQVDQAHASYFRAMVDGAKKDGVITEDESSALAEVASSLGIDSTQVPPATHVDATLDSVLAGASVCFTGTCLDPNGNPISKSRLREMALDAGFVVVSDVTKSTCDVLIAVDPHANSAKAKKARKFGKPIVSAKDFLEVRLCFGCPSGPRGG